MSGHDDLELDGTADLPAVCVWLKPNREDADFYVERSGNLGTATAAGVESRNRRAGVRVKLLATGRIERQLRVAKQGFRKHFLKNQNINNVCREIAF